MEISKLKLGGNVLHLKDKAARETILNVATMLNFDELKDGQSIVWDSANEKFTTVESDEKLTDNDFEDIFK